MLLVGVVVFVGALWLVVTGLLVYRSSHAIERDLATVRDQIAAGNTTGLATLTDRLATETGHAHALTSGPAWWVAAHVPLFGAPAQIARGVTKAAHTIGSSALPAIAQAGTTIDPGQLLRGDTIQLASIERVAPQLSRATNALQSSLATLQRLPGRTWLVPADRLRDRLVAQLTPVEGTVTAVNRAAQVLPEMAGGHGVRRYFVGLENEAEMRGTGGLPGAFAILQADNGVLSFTHFESDSALEGSPSDQRVETGLDFGSDYDKAWGGFGPTYFYINSNMSPNFPNAAQIWAAMWQKVSGEHLDGAIAIDPTALSHLLDVAGPARTSDGTQISGDNVVALTEKDLYSRFPDDSERKTFLVSLLQAVADHLLHNSGSSTDLIKQIAALSTQHRILIWSADPSSQRLLAQTSYAGQIPKGAQPFEAMVVNNLGGNKLDYYLDRSLNYVRTGCGASSATTVTLKLTNRAPASGLSAVVTGQLGNANKGVSPGDSRALVDYVTTNGTELLGVTLNGKQWSASSQTEQGHPVFRFDLALPRGQTQTLVLHLSEPTSSVAPQFWEQPGVNRESINWSYQRCGA